MHLQDINKLLNLQEVTIKDISNSIDNTIWITLEPTSSIQSCDCCQSHSVIRKGFVGYRKVRHLPFFQYKTILLLPKIRMLCKECGVNFSWQYSFVQGKSRTTNAFKEQLALNTMGSTVAHTSTITQLSYSSCERIFKQYLETFLPVLDQKAKECSKNTPTLILGIDDFAIRKGHRYNTAIHDIRNGSLLHILEGRKLQDLWSDYENYPEVYQLKPVAVVMDLARYYHTFVAKVFPNAIRIADRFHVNRYLLDALQQIRRRVSQGTSSQNRTLLKRHKHVLSKRFEDLTSYEKNILNQLLTIHEDLRAAYDLKEELITWYECISHILPAKVVFKRWLSKGKSLAIPELNAALKTFSNWEEEITNYHYYRFTNASVEGRNNKIKSLQRRCYFIRNRKYYVYRIKAECNRDLFLG